MFTHSNKYICICGSEFTNSQAFNGHKSHCKVHHIDKYGDLTTLYSTYAKRNKHISETLNTDKVKRNKILRDLLKVLQTRIWILEKHKCEKCGNIITKYYGSGRFCSSKCAKSFSTSNKRKEISEKISNTKKQQNSNKCKNFKKILILNYENNPKYCINCGIKLQFENRKRKTCSQECLNAVNLKNARIAGLKSAISQNKRSKNEIKFCILCENYFGKENVLHNEPMFNGWDADIIILPIKVAILWNGPWHYKKITKKHSLKQVQNRDKLKLQNIRNNGFIPYVIKDLGKENKDKVEDEFNKFLNYVNKIS